MGILRIGVLSIVLIGALSAQPADTVQPHAKMALLVYDKVDNNSKFFVEGFREQLKASGIPFEEAAVESTQIRDVSRYEYLVIYSRVMAFTMISPVKRWVRSMASFENKKVLLFVTAQVFGASDSSASMTTGMCV